MSDESLIQSFPARTRVVLIAIGILAVVSFAVRIWRGASASFPGGFAIHWIGAWALNVLILAALLSGPYNWDRYTDWAILPLVHFARPEFLRRYGAPVLLGGVLLALPTFSYTPAQMAQYPWVTLLTGQMTLGLPVWLTLGVVWLYRWPADAPRASTGA